MDSAVTVLTPGSEREILRKVLPIWVEEINTQFDSRPSTRWHTALHFVLFDDDPENVSQCSKYQNYYHRPPAEQRA